MRQADIRHSLTISWRHRPAGDRMLLATPLGQNVAELTRDATGARLVLADGRSYVGANWDSLSEALFGSPLPLDSLPAWLAGQVGPAPTGWQATVLDAPGAAAGGPTMVEFARGEFAVRLRIDSWSAP